MQKGTSRVLAILPLVLAVFSAGLVPHLHVHGDDPGSTRLESAAVASLPVAKGNLDAVGCLACRITQPKRAMAVVPSAFRLSLERPGAEGPFPDLSTPLVAQLLRSVSPPRAPPV